eukprot:GHVR01147028.1.p1 GENE.GHVR01147028.1~~GHVR01147028.1.p1  ORF type:complete len:122 (-),score=12.16 GHVR01147028.1:654-1019(-)
MLACLDGHIDAVTRLYEKGAAVLEDRDKDGRTPLMLACSDGHVHVMEWLHRKGANLKTKDNNGMNAWMLAVKGGRFDSGHWLQDKGVAFEEKDIVNNVLLALYYSCGLNGFIYLRLLIWIC